MPLSSPRNWRRQTAWEDGRQPQVYQRPMHTIWTVPIDDTRTMNISFMLVDDHDGAAGDHQTSIG